MHRKSVENCHSIRINLVPPIIQVDKTVELSTSHHRYRIKRWNILFFLFFSSGKHQHFVYIDNSLTSQIRCEKNPFSSSSIYPKISIDFATRLIEFTIYDLVPSRDNFNEEQKRETVRKKSRKSRSFSRVADPRKKTYKIQTIQSCRSTFRKNRIHKKKIQRDILRRNQIFRYSLLSKCLSIFN